VSQLRDNLGKSHLMGQKKLMLEETSRTDCTLKQGDFGSRVFLFCQEEGSSVWNRKGENNYCSL